MQGVQQFLNNLFTFCQFVMVYYTTILGFCALISVIVLGFILILRSTAFSQYVFGKAALWALMIPCLFCGKLHLFFESKVGVRLFYWWYDICASYQVISLIYISVGIVLAGYYIHRRSGLLKKIREFEECKYISSKYDIRQFPAEISSFCVGCIRPVIVIPKRIEKDQAEVIAKHEETHIILGHLWIQLLWEVIMVLLWPNILLQFSEKYLKRDLEDVCDAVTIQRGGIDSIHYGKVLFENARRLTDRNEIPEIESGFFFLRNDSYKALRRRIEKITNFISYNPRQLVLNTVLLLSALIIMIAGIKSVSYARYSTMENSSVFSTDRMDIVAIDNNSAIVTSYDDEYIYIDCKELKNQCPDIVNEINDIYFATGGYYKIPGMGGGCDIGILSPETVKASNGIIKTPKYNGIDTWNRIIMWL